MATKKCSIVSKQGAVYSSDLRGMPCTKHSSGRHLPEPAARPQTLAQAAAGAPAAAACHCPAPQPAPPHAPRAAGGWSPAASAGSPPFLSLPTQLLPGSWRRHCRSCMPAMGDHEGECMKLRNPLIRTSTYATGGWLQSQRPHWADSWRRQWQWQKQAG